MIETTESGDSTFVYDIAEYYSADCSDKMLNANGELIDSPLNYAVTKNFKADGTADTYAQDYYYTSSSDCSVDGEATVVLDADTDLPLNPVYGKHKMTFYADAKTAHDGFKVLTLVAGKEVGYIENYYSTPGCAAGKLAGSNFFEIEGCHTSLSANSLSLTATSFKWEDIQTLKKYDDDACGTEAVAPDDLYPKFTPDLTSCQAVSSSKYTSGIPVLGAYFLQSGNIFQSDAPTSAPTFVAEVWNQGGQVTWDKRRTRKGGLCENRCSGHGTCELNQNCVCYKGLDGEPEWTGPDCSLRTCPHDYAWVGAVVNANDLHPWAECSNKGKGQMTKPCQ